MKDPSEKKGKKSQKTAGGARAANFLGNNGAKTGITASIIRPDLTST